MVTEQVRGKAKPDVCPTEQVGAAQRLWLASGPLPVDTGQRGCPARCRPLSQASGVSSEQKNSQVLLLNAKPSGA